LPSLPTHQQMWRRALCWANSSGLVVLRSCQLEAQLRLSSSMHGRSSADAMPFAIVVFPEPEVPTTTTRIAALARTAISKILDPVGRQVSVARLWQTYSAPRAPSQGSLARSRLQRNRITARSSAACLLLCRFSDAGMPSPSTRAGGRRPKSAKARNRGG
jgi:hypothetical protein